jgi:dienelactone hydrolase
MKMLMYAVVLSSALWVASASGADGLMRKEVEKIRSLSTLVQPPAVYPAEGLELKTGTPGQTFRGNPDAYDIRPLFYEGLPYKGQPTRVFAWYGVPKDATGKVPAVVLVHGGGGTAFSEWVRQWNDRGFAALAMAHEGQLEILMDPEKKRRVWKKHAWPGPARTGIYADSAEPIEDQYMYHAVADTILANSLLRSLPEVDAEKVGIMGISWGGVIASTAIGIDHRFAFAIPTYGCGHLYDTGNQWGRALGNNDLYIGAWDPFLRMSEVTIPVCWYSWPGDNHFDLAAQAKTYRAMPGPKMIILRPNMGHGGGCAWGPPDSYAFAESILETGRPWAWQVAIQKENPVRVVFHCTRPVDRAELICTMDTGFTGDRTWLQAEAPFTTEQDRVIVSPVIPPGTTGWIVNLWCGELLVSSEYFDCAF